METLTSTAVQPLNSEEINALKKFYAAWKEKRPEWLDEVCTPDWKDIPLNPGQAAGPNGLKDIIAFFTGRYSDVEIIIHEIVGTHERAATRSEIRFTHNKSLFGIPAVNRQVTIALHEFHHLKDGKITHTWHLEDWFSLLMQSGAWNMAEKY